jgi:hypothetical protein
VLPVVVTIYQLANLLGAVILPGIETALKIKATLESLGPEFKANIHQLGDAALLADKETIDKVNGWLTANGFDALPPDVPLVQ